MFNNGFKTTLPKIGNLAGISLIAGSACTAETYSADFEKNLIANIERPANFFNKSPNLKQLNENQSEHVVDRINSNLPGYSQESNTAIDLNSAFFGTLRPENNFNEQEQGDFLNLNLPPRAEFIFDVSHEIDRTSLASITIYQTLVSNPQQFTELSELIEYDNSSGVLNRNNNNRLDRLNAGVEERAGLCLATAAVLAASFALDGSVPLDSNAFTTVGNLAGDKEGFVALTFAPIILGELFNNPKLSEAGTIALESAIYTGILTELTKEIVGRERPDGSDDRSWLSGHTTFTAAMAGTYTKLSDWDPVVTISTNSLALITAYARVASENHHESDVLWSLVAGWTIGYLNASFRLDHETPFTVEPYNDGFASGISINYRF